mmetsp:Transcript_56524/g.183720  ORF Transcript_56524/g.183720 Transcript_56524/m.183720 type:complete len:209 (+) Transcript_56524:695-1321(+)
MLDRFASTWLPACRAPVPGPAPGRLPARSWHGQLHVPAALHRAKQRGVACRRLHPPRTALHDLRVVGSGKPAEGFSLRRCAGTGVAETSRLVCRLRLRCGVPFVVCLLGIRSQQRGLAVPLSEDGPHRPGLLPGGCGSLQPLPVPHAGGMPSLRGSHCAVPIVFAYLYAADVGRDLPAVGLPRHLHPVLGASLERHGWHRGAVAKCRR